MSGKSKVDPKFRYTSSHEWVERVSDAQVRIGITDHAQESLGDITYFEFPEIGKVYEKGETLGFVESVKAVSDIYAPITLEITQINPELTETPEVVNQSPYIQGWYIQGKIKKTNQLEDLLDAVAYEGYLASEEQ